MRITPELALVRAQAALGRAPQDKLEASVVLESWGLTQAEAMGVAGPGATSLPPSALDQRPAMTRPEERQNLLEIMGLVAGLLAASLWAAPLVARLGEGAEFAWRLALPATFLLQWMLRRRYFSNLDLRPRDRLSGLRSERAALPLAVVVAIVLPAALLWAAAPVGAAIALVVIWTGGLLLVRRGWAVLYIALLLGGTLALSARFPVTYDVLGESGAVLAAVVAAVISSRSPKRWPRSWREAIPSGLVGLCLGIIIVAYRFPVTTDGLRLLGIAMLPPLLGSLAWFWRLSDFWREIWFDLATTGVHDPSRRHMTHTARRINLMALAGYLLVTIPLAAVGLELARLSGIASSSAWVMFVDLGVLGLASAGVAWVEVVCRPAVALRVCLCAIAAGTAAYFAPALAWSSNSELVAASAAVVIAGIVLFLAHRQPDRMSAQLL